MKLHLSFFIILFISLSYNCIAQDSTIMDDGQKFTLTEAIVRNHFDYKEILQRIKQDTSFYKAFKTLRTIGYSSYNHIEMADENNKMQASLNSKTRQNKIGGCRTMDVLEETITGDLLNKKGEYNYTTPSLYASLFFTKGSICGELYDYKLDYVEYHGQLVYVFDVQPKADLGFFVKDRIVVDQMITWFNPKTLEVLGRNYSLSYKAGVYDFNVSMEVEMNYFNGQLVPKILRYKGNWDVIFKKRERGLFTATLFDYKLGL